MLRATLSLEPWIPVPWGASILYERPVEISLVPPTKHAVLAGLLVAVTALTAFIVADLLATIFFGLTVATVLVPVVRWLQSRGLPRWWASAVATGLAVVGGVAVLLPVGIVLYIRRRQAIALITSIPDQFQIEAFGLAYAVETADLSRIAITYLRNVAVSLAQGTPLLIAQAIVFVFVVFALVHRREAVGRALLAPLPSEYHDIATGLYDRFRETAFALYIIQAATAAGTFLIASVFFVALGYQYPITLGVAAGILQFLPVVGPSIVIIGLAALELSVGAVNRAAIVLLLGLVLVAALPDAVLRPRLARETARLPASLYFVGFTGGILSLGPVGVIAGPLVVALLVELLAILADERKAGHS